MHLTITSKTISTITQIHHGKLMRHIADMVTAGTIDKSRLKTWGGRIRFEATTDLDLKDVAALIAHLRPKRRVIDALIDAFEIVDVTPTKAPRGGAVLEVLPRSDKDQLRRIFNRQQDIVNAVLSGDDEAMLELGIRRSGDDYWIGTSTPRMVEINDEEGLGYGGLSRALTKLGGVKVVGAKRFDGQVSKALELPGPLMRYLLTKPADEV